jgi:hypothetical protein
MVLKGFDFCGKKTDKLTEPEKHFRTRIIFSLSLKLDYQILYYFPKLVQPCFQC